MSDFTAIGKTAILGSLLAVVALSKTPPPPAVCDRTIAESELRKKFATNVVHPSYPVEAIRSKVMGIAVAEICVPAGGNVAKINIVAAPNEVIRKAMEDALGQWRFGPMWTPGDTSHLLAYGGKLVYYFVEEGGQWKVLSPADSFYVGPRFAR